VPRTVGSSIEARTEPYRRAKRYPKPGPHVALICSNHLRRWHEEVICMFREDRRRTSPKPKVYNANVRFFVYDVCHGRCELCCVDGIFWGSGRAAGAGRWKDGAPGQCVAERNLPRTATVKS
jgi:hypothetical protein